MSDHKPRSMFGEAPKEPSRQPGGDVFSDVVKVQSDRKALLGGEHASGLLKGRRKIVRMLVVVASLMGLLWAVGAWIGAVTEGSSSVGFQAARNIDKSSFESWLYNDMVQEGYTGEPFGIPEGAIETSVGAMYTSVLNNILVDPDMPSTWDLEPLLVYSDLEDGTYEIMPLSLEFPFDVSSVVQLLVTFNLIIGVLTVILLGGALVMAREGGRQAIGWTMRITGWRWALAGGLSVVWMLWQTAKFVGGGNAVSGPWLSRNLSIMVIGWNPVPYVLLGLIGIVLWGVGIVLRDKKQ